MIFLLYFIIIPIISQGQEALTIAAVGRTAKLGDVYDARTNTFTHSKLFKSKMADYFIETIDNPNTQLMKTFASTQSEKLDALNIGGELKLQIMCNTIKPDGAANFAKSSYTKHEHIEINYIVKIKTKKDFLDWQSASDSLGLHATEGTHFVVGIQYGGNGILTISQTIDETSKPEEIKARLNGIFVNAFDGKANYEISEHVSEKAYHFNIQVNADVEISVDTIADTQKFSENLFIQLKACNNGKGVQIGFEMLPVNVLYNYLRISVPNALMYKPLSQSQMAILTAKMEMLEKRAQKFYKHFFELQEYSLYMSPDEEDNLMEQKSMFEEKIGIMHAEISTTIVKLHEGSAAAVSILNFDDEEMRLKEIVTKFLEKSEDIMMKANFVKYFEKNGFIYISNSTDLELFKTSYDSIFFVFLAQQNYQNIQGQLMSIDKIQFNGFGIINIERLLLSEEEKRMSKDFNYHPFFYCGHKIYYKMMSKNYNEWFIFPVYLTENIGCNLTTAQPNAPNATIDIFKAGTGLPAKKGFRFENTELSASFYIQIYSGKNIIKTVTVDTTVNGKFNSTMEITVYGEFLFEITHTASNSTKGINSYFLWRRLKKLNKNLLLN